MDVGWYLCLSAVFPESTSAASLAWGNHVLREGACADALSSAVIESMH